MNGPSPVTRPRPTPKKILPPREALACAGCGYQIPDEQIEPQRRSVFPVERLGIQLECPRCAFCWFTEAVRR